jgi:hypothetical protein
MERSDTIILGTLAHFSHFRHSKKLAHFFLHYDNRFTKIHHRRAPILVEYRLKLEHLERFHYLYQRASADLAKISTFSAEPNTRLYLESLVGRAFGEIHETREKPHRLRPLYWFFTIFPQTFRKHIRAFWMSLLAIMVGAAFGGFTIIVDSNTKQILLPFSHLQGDPSDRVKKEEGVDTDRLKGSKTTFSSFLMTL